MPFAVLVEHALISIEHLASFTAPPGIGETAAVLVFVPLATALILGGSHRFEAAYLKKAEVPPPAAKPTVKEMRKTVREQVTGIG